MQVCVCRFQALHQCSGVGLQGFGGDTAAVAAELSKNFTLVAHTFTTVAALKHDGSVVTSGAMRTAAATPLKCSTC